MSWQLFKLLPCESNELLPTDVLSNKKLPSLNLLAVLILSTLNISFDFQLIRV